MPPAVGGEVEATVPDQAPQDRGAREPVLRVRHRRILLAHLTAVLVEPLGGGRENPQVGVVERPVEGDVAAHSVVGGHPDQLDDALDVLQGEADTGQ